MTEGGILSVLRHVVAASEQVLPPEWRIVVLVHRRSLLSVGRAEVREFPEIKASWFRRMQFELLTSRRLARELSATVWFALHDITPLVDVSKQFVYCHNPTCFSRLSLRALYFDRVFVAHSLFYGFLYSLNIRRNTRVFVQQSWIRDAFIRRFRAQDVSVSRPAPIQSALVRSHEARRQNGALRQWIYPTFPRHFKNVEVIGEALAILERDSTWQGEVQVTISGDEGAYARYLRRRFGALKSLRFIGRQDASAMGALYANADGLLFPSTLETWGMPITEAQEYGLPMLVADRAYAHETVGTYDGVTFFDPHDAPALARMLKDLVDGCSHLGSAQAPNSGQVPTLVGWEQLVRSVCDLPEFNS
jgi:glycosyltransferase involved in cell wall biosynthesis